MIRTAFHDDVLVVELNNPPVNALRQSLDSEVERALDKGRSANVRAIVFLGAGRMFSGGADVQEFKSTARPSWLQEVIGLIEASTVPTVAAIHGAALGGGLELALGCHYRVATPDAKIALPEVKLGILPGAGGTQRLPRLVDMETAVRMVVGGETIDAREALAIGLVDQIISDENWKEAAIAFARGLDRPRRTAEMPPPEDGQAISALAAKLRQNVALQAPKVAVEALQAAASLPFVDGLQREQDLVSRLLASPQAVALQHLFFAERSAAKIKDVPKDIRKRDISKVGVIGAGTMGTGIAINFLLISVPVMLVDQQQDALERGIASIDRMLDSALRKGRLTSDQVASARSHLSTTLQLDDLRSCDLIIEAVFENLAIKKQMFERLERVAKQGAILASNTSFLDIDAMAAVTDRPHDVLGLHFFSPANIMKLVEVVRGRETAADVLATAVHLCRKIDKVPVISRVGHGFIANRMVTPRQREAYALLLEGASPSEVDRIHTDFGMPMGPFQVEDLAGVDIGWHRDPERIETIRDALCAAGRLGQKTGAGFYDYDAARKPVPSAFTTAIIEDFRRRAGILPRKIGEEEIRVRTLFTMVNEGAEILREGIAQRASDIDVAMVLGYGWPRQTGGPMHWADTTGLASIVSGLRGYEARLPADFALSPLLLECAAAGIPLDC